MKKLIVILITGFILAACAGNAKRQIPAEISPMDFQQEQPEALFSDITGKSWKLIEVHLNGEKIIINRDREEFSGFFTLTFDAENVSGTGAPNLYSAPYTVNGKTISIMLMRSTLMAALFEPENFKEHEYFIHMQNAFEWNLTGENLEIISNNENGSRVVLVFSL
jgi:heat shock protein HslJ